MRARLLTVYQRRCRSTDIAVAETRERDGGEHDEGDPDPDQTHPVGCRDRDVGDVVQRADGQCPLGKLERRPEDGQCECNDDGQPADETHSGARANRGSGDRHECPHGGDGGCGLSDDARN